MSWAVNDPVTFIKNELAINECLTALCVCLCVGVYRITKLRDGGSVWAIKYLGLGNLLI